MIKSHYPLKRKIRLGSYCLLFLLLHILCLPTAESCGPIVGTSYTYTFIGKSLMLDAAAVAPTLMNVDDVYRYFYTPPQHRQRVNLREWQERVCESASLEDIRAIVYEATTDDLNRAKRYLKDQKTSLPGIFERNDFIDYLLDLKCDETLDYLIFAKRCEPEVVAPENSWERPRRSISRMNNLIDDGIQQFRKTKSDYIRLRYAFQIIRLAHYSKNYERTLKLCDYLLPKTEERNSILYHWILGHKAGALRATEKRVEAAYLYTQIFANAPECRDFAFQSFNIQTDEEWDTCYLKCKDANEIASLYTIRASADGSRSAVEMENIYNIDPKSKFLELLLVKELKYLEKDLLGVPIGKGVQRYQRQVLKKPTNEQGKRIIALQAFARKCRLEKKVKNTTLWHIAEGYCEFLAGDYYEAKKTFFEVQDDVQSQALKDQLRVFSTVLEIARIKRLDPKTKKKLLFFSSDQELQQQFPSFRDFFADKIAQLYTEDNRPGMAFRAYYPIEIIKYNPQMAIIDDLLKTIEMGDTISDLELMLGRDTLGINAKSDLLDMKATLLMSQHEYRRALDVLNRMDRLEWRRYGEFSPFVERFMDCVHCDENKGLVIDTSKIFTKGEILETIIRSETDARLGSPKAARIYYNLGIGLYNMSYFGHQWKAMDYFRSGGTNASWNLVAPDGIVPDVRFPYGNRENLDVSKAQEYFEEARRIADERKDFELAAKATFMAAKCEQKAFFTSGLYQTDFGNNIPLLPEEYLVNFRLLEELYRDTDFYPRIISECKYFEVYSER